MCVCVSKSRGHTRICFLACAFVWLFMILCKCVCVCVLWSWELTGSVHRGSLIQCFEMSPPAVVGLRDCCLGGGLEMLRCAFCLHSSRTFLLFFLSCSLSCFCFNLHLNFSLPKSSAFNFYVALTINPHTVLRLPGQSVKVVTFCMNSLFFVANPQIWTYSRLSACRK